MSANQQTLACNDAEIKARRPWRTVAAENATLDQRLQPRRNAADLRAVARIWQDRIAAGSFGTSWYLLRSTK